MNVYIFVKINQIYKNNILIYVILFDLYYKIYYNKKIQKKKKLKIKNIKKTLLEKKFSNEKIFYIIKRNFYFFFLFI